MKRMKRMTIKLKITLWFSTVMFLLCAAVFVFVSVVSHSSANNEIRGELTDRVGKNAREIEYDDGQMDIDDDFVFFKSGIYCLIYDANGGKINGYAPYPELENASFQDGEMREITVGDETFLIFDRLVSLGRYESAWIRGAAMERAAPSATYRAVLVALPVLALLAAAGGYLVAGRLLRPIQKISATAEEIGKSGNLAKRIEIDGGGDELHRLSGTFNRMFEQLENNFEAERHFTSDASHELRTPVATILAQCEYAFENASGEQQLYEAIGAIQKQGYRMSRLIDSLLRFTRMEQKTEARSPETVNLSELLQSVCREQAERAEKNIQLTEAIEPGISMRADSGEMGVLLGNLCRNAYRYGRENGSIHVSLKTEQGSILLTVTDDGIGIAREDIPKIWNRFYRADRARASDGDGGLGLGLAMVKQIAELHGGKADVQSEIGKGSVFTVRFPVE